MSEVRERQQIDALLREAGWYMHDAAAASIHSQRGASFRSRATASPITCCISTVAHSCCDGLWRDAEHREQQARACIGRPIGVHSDGAMSEAFKPVSQAAVEVLEELGQTRHRESLDLGDAPATILVTKVRRGGRGH